MKNNKNNWREQQKLEKENAYKTIDEMADKVKQEIDSLKEYLRVQATFDRYSSNNCLLIASKMPTATLLKDRDGWGSSLKPNQDHLIILEPSDPYVKADGKKTIYYNPKRMYDISQTIEQLPEKEEIKDVAKLTALLNLCPVDIKIVDQIGDTDKKAIWNKDENVLYVRRVKNPKDAFKSVSIELARANFDDNSSYELENFKCYCVSYILCKKYDVDISFNEFDEIPQEFKNMTAKEVKEELSSIRNITIDMEMRMENYFDKENKKHRNKEYER